MSVTGYTFFVNLVSLFQVKEVVVLVKTLIEILDIMGEYLHWEVVVE